MGRQRHCGGHGAPVTPVFGRTEKNGGCVQVIWSGTLWIEFWDSVLFFVVLVSTFRIQNECFRIPHVGI